MQITFGKISRYVGSSLKMAELYTAAGAAAVATIRLSHRRAAQLLFILGYLETTPRPYVVLAVSATYILLALKFNQV